MSNKLYLECNSGISGDMMVASLLDLGASVEVLNSALSSIPVGGFRTVVSKVKKSGLEACDFDVILEEKNHDHDMEYLYGHEKSGHTHGEEHTHSGEEHTHSEKHTHGGEEHTHDGTHHHQNVEHTHAHAQEHRGLGEILDIIDKTDITVRAKAIASKIFNILGIAESKVHGTKIEEVHFHEVGAVDSIVDIIAVAVCLDNLNISEVIVPILYEGSGTVRCQHGILPIPVPAVANIVSSHGLRLHITNTQGELVTPTGAAIVAAIKTEDKLPEQFTIQKIGMGAGKRTHDRLSILRAMLIQEEML